MNGRYKECHTQATAHQTGIYLFIFHISFYSSSFFSFLLKTTTTKKKRRKERDREEYSYIFFFMISAFRHALDDGRPQSSRVRELKEKKTFFHAAAPAAAYP
jgi:hypothetical protein